MSLKKTKITTPGYHKRIGYHSMLVGGTALLATVLLAAGDLSTREAIAMRKAEDLQAMLTQVIPSDIYDNNLLSDKFELAEKEIYQARMESKVSAVAFEVFEPGYSGVITLIMSVSSEGKLLGVRVISHTETPGLGDKMETARSNWILSFDGRSLNKENEKNWAVKKDGGEFDQFTGATITPRAIIKAVKGGLVFFKNNKQRLLSYEPPSTSEGNKDE